MPAGLLHTDQHRLNSIHDFVFRDFERSRILRIRGQLETRAGLFTMAYLGVVIFWTALMSYSAANLGDPSPALNLTPHIGHFLLILGALLYPKRLLWLPILVFALVYLLPFSLPASDTNLSWMQIPAMTPALIFWEFASLLVSGVLAGLLVRRFCARAKDRVSPYRADMVTVIAVFVAFIMLSLLQMALIWIYAQTLPPEAQISLGFDTNFLHLGFERILRGGAVIAAFLLAILEISNRSDLQRGILLAPVFPLLALLQSYGFELYAALDAAILALVLMMVLPVPLAIGSCIIGVPMYSALTGNFVNSAYIHDVNADMFEHYSILIMLLAVLVLTLRALGRHDLRHRMASLRRLSMVRDFANTGLLSFNLDHHRFRADASAQRLFALPAEGDAARFTALFEAGDRAKVVQALQAHNQDRVTLLLTRRIEAVTGTEQVLRISLWYETAASGERICYGLAMDVTADHEQERALQQTLGELSSRQDRQRQLFSIISHELRTPASVIAMLVQNLDQGPVKDATRRQLLDATGQLMSILADMRQTVTPTQNLPIKKVNFTPAELAETLRSMFEPQARAYGIQIRLRLDDSAQLLRSNDQMRIRQALSNLLRNAILHSKGKVITLSFEMLSEPEQTSLWQVQDDGIGIAPQDVARLFEPFERGQQDPRSQADGSGLGLFIAKSSIEALGGSLSFFAPKGGGAGYRVQLPEAIVVPPLHPQPDPPKQPDTTGFSQLYILLAEDNQLVAEVTAALLAKVVGRIEIASTGRAALEKVLADPPDLLITDLFMPEMNGDDLVRQIRELGMALPVVGATAAVVGDDVERFHAAGADRVMSKPLDFNTLYELMRTITAKPNIANLTKAGS